MSLLASVFVSALSASAAPAMYQPSWDANSRLDPADRWVFQGRDVVDVGSVSELRSLLESQKSTSVSRDRHGYSVSGAFGMTAKSNLSGAGPLPAKPVKDEFETESEFAKRLSEWQGVLAERYHAERAQRVQHVYRLVFTGLRVSGEYDAEDECWPNGLHYGPDKPSSSRGVFGASLESGALRYLSVLDSPKAGLKEATLVSTSAVCVPRTEAKAFRDGLASRKTELIVYVVPDMYNQADAFGYLLIDDEVQAYPERDRLYKHRSWRHRYSTEVKDEVDICPPDVCSK